MAKKVLRKNKKKIFEQYKLSSQENLIHADYQLEMENQINI